MASAITTSSTGTPSATGGTCRSTTRGHCHCAGRHRPGALLHRRVRVEARHARSPRSTRPREATFSADRPVPRRRRVGRCRSAQGHRAGVGARADPRREVVDRPRVLVNAGDGGSVGRRCCWRWSLLVARFIWRTGRDRRTTDGRRARASGRCWTAKAAPCSTDRRTKRVRRRSACSSTRRADPLDVTATIIDLGVRGFLTIEETEKGGLFHKADWKLTKLKDDDGDDC